jgi:glycosyltransferase involved in cell wall biosynthesis
MTHQPSWICCQLGAREHYAIPRALHQTRNLSLLMTDAWAPPRSPLKSLFPFRALKERFHPDLAQAPVQDFTLSLMQFEFTHQLKKTGSWQRMIARNQWFQTLAVHQLQKLASRIVKADSRPILFAYSYAALDLLHYANSQGWYTILGQIDPGPVEEQIVTAEHQKHPQLAPVWQPVPPQYWERWRAECKLADRILVNSNWSKQALQKADIETNKIEIVPLFYTPPTETHNFQRTYPKQFSAHRPLRVLFLGQIILRKGIASILEAAKLLQDEPVEFWMVGSIGIERSQVTLPNIRWLGTVHRSEVSQYYKEADVFLFPTLSDGFGLTQLEAQAWRLPLVVSQRCGDVVKDQVNGLVLPEITGGSIVDTLRKLLIEPNLLKHLSQSSYPQCQGLTPLSQQLQNIAVDLTSKTKVTTL